MTFTSLENRDLDSEKNAQFRAQESEAKQVGAEKPKPISVKDLLRLAEDLGMPETDEMLGLRAKSTIGQSRNRLESLAEKYGELGVAEVAFLDEVFHPDGYIGVMVAKAAVFLQAGDIAKAIELIDDGAETANKMKDKEPSFVWLELYLDRLKDRLQASQSLE